MSGGGNLEIDVCICSYRRPQIAETFAALASQYGTAQRNFRVFVADNTRDGAARILVARASRTLGLDLHYIHAPADNISIARNACLDAARAEWIAFIDDDEIPAQNWLSAMLREARRSGSDVVLGPVLAIYPDSARPWLRRGNFHSTAPVWRDGEIAGAYTGNVLFRRDLVERARLRFRADLGTTGGEDDDFFERFRASGGQIGYAPDAVCFERVPPSRANLSWLLRRSFRAGQSHGTRLRIGARRIRVTPPLAKALVCTLGAVLTMPDAVRRNRYLARAALHSGVCARLLGLREIGMYRNPPQ